MSHTPLSCMPTAQISNFCDNMQSSERSSGVVEGERGERRSPNKMSGGTAFAQLLSGQGGTVIQ